MFVAQLILFALLAIGFLMNVNHIVSGRPAEAPRGFSALVITFIVYGLLVWCYLSAGAFSQLLG